MPPLPVVPPAARLASVADFWTFLSADLLLSLLSQYSLATSSSLSSIPALTSSSRANTLVRFRCLLQDTTAGPEIFLPHSQGQLPVQEGQDIDYSKLRERQVAFAVGVPGEARWVDDVSSTRFPFPPPAGRKSSLSAASSAEPRPGRVASRTAD